MGVPNRARDLGTVISSGQGEGVGACLTSGCHGILGPRVRGWRVASGRGAGQSLLLPLTECVRGRGDGGRPGGICDVQCVLVVCV